jgi:hypothetical protein
MMNSELSYTDRYLGRRAIQRNVHHIPVAAQTAEINYSY